MDDDKTRNRRVGTPVPGCPQIPSPQEARPHFLHQNKAQNAKTGSTSQLFWGVGCASLLYFCEKWGLNFLRFKNGSLPHYFRLSSTATATETVIPTMGLLPAPRKPIISTSNPPVGGFVPAARGLFEQEARLFVKQEAHRTKAVCCAFLPWGHLITSSVHETRCFDLIIQLLSSFFHLYHLLTSFNHPPPRVSENKS